MGAQCAKGPGQNKENKEKQEVPVESDSEDEAEVHVPRRRGAIDDRTVSAVAADERAVALGTVDNRNHEDFNLAALRGSVDDDTCTALLALRMGRGSSVGGLIKDGTSSNGTSEHGGSLDLQAGGAAGHLMNHGQPLAPLPENDSVRPSDGGALEGRDDSVGGTGTAADTAVQPDANAVAKISGGGDGGGKTKTATRRMDSGLVLEAELGYVRATGGGGVAPIVPTRI